ncbi:MAG: trigger factor [Lachnospiraceae bacterium]|nr:trigger factor [Lachnospiraceae bacterium]
MKKKILAIVFCVSMFFLMCACNATTPTKSELPTPQGGDKTRPRATETPIPTVEGGDTEEVPITDYEECVATTKLAKDYAGILVEKVTDEELEDYIREILEQNRMLEERDRAIQNGDNANIDFTGYLDGEPFDGGADTGFDLEIGSGSFIDGFEEGLIGAKKGETRSLELNFPEDYKRNPDMAGKAVVFEVKINSVSEYVLPELTDDFVSDLTYGDYPTVQEFRDYCMEYLTEEKQYLTVTDYLVENTEFSNLNEAYIQASLESMKSYYEMYAVMYGVDLETFMLMLGVEDSAAFWSEMEAEMRRLEKERIALYCVAKAEGITLTEEEFTQYATELAESYQMTLEEFLEDRERKYIEQSLLMERALEFLLDNVIEK